MAALPTPIKENPIKSVIALLTFVGSIVGGVFVVDDRYVSAAELYVVQQEVSNIQQEMSKQFKALRMKQLQDEIFILNFKVEEGTATSLDKALLERKKQELEALKNES